MSLPEISFDQRLSELYHIRKDLERRLADQKEKLPQDELALDDFTKQQKAQVKSRLPWKRKIQANQTRRQEEYLKCECNLTRAEGESLQNTLDRVSMAIALLEAGVIPPDMTDQ